MQMRAALPLLLVAPLVSGCLGVENMGEFKSALGFAPEPLDVLEPVARIRASLTLAHVGQEVAFSAQGSSDPQGLPLRFAWSFGDGAGADGGEAVHAYADPGAYTVLLEARNGADVAGADTLLLTVLDNRPPTATPVAMKDGNAVDRVRTGEKVTFDAQAADPEGQPVSVRWDFGDGDTALTPRTEHAFARGGRYAVTLSATDPHGLSGTGQLALAVDSVVSGAGQLSMLAEAPGEHAVDVADGARGARVEVTFDAGLGLHAIEVALLDAGGAEVARKAGSAPLAAQGAASAVLEVPGEALRGHAPGTWRIVVERTAGLMVDYELSALVSY
jgi:PKD repeat protein